MEEDRMGCGLNFGFGGCDILCIIILIILICCLCPGLFGGFSKKC